MSLAADLSALPTALRVRNASDVLTWLDCFFSSAASDHKQANSSSSDFSVEQSTDLGDLYDGNDPRTISSIW